MNLKTKLLIRILVVGIVLLSECVEEKQEKIVVSTGCMDIISYSALSEEQQKEECFQRLEIQEINNFDCEFMDAEVVSCGPEVLGDRLVCTFICKEVTNEK